MPSIIVQDTPWIKARCVYGWSRSSVSIIDRSDTSIIDNSALYYRYIVTTNPFFIETNFRNRINVDERPIVIVDEGKCFYGPTYVCVCGRRYIYKCK